MKQSFRTEDLKLALERSLGFALRSLVRLDGASAVNFRAERESDALVFLVKCSPKSRQVMFDHLVCHLRELEGAKAVHRLFASECIGEFAGYNVICLSWCVGERMFPDRLSEAQLLAFLDDYQAFSRAMQKSTGVVRHDPLLTWRAMTLLQCTGICGHVLRSFVEREIPAESVTYDEGRLRTIHGDFHHGNFLFVNGAVTGFFDLEEFCEGYPADDIVRYFVCAAEHLRWYELWRLNRLLSRFALSVRHLPYAADEWTLAINGLLMRKIFMKTRDGVGLFGLINLRFRARLYLKMRRLVSRAGL